MQSQDVMIELDALLDTRFGLLCARFPSQVPTVDMEQYVNRNKDNLPELFGVDKERWEEAWDKRDVSILKHSHVTTLGKTLSRLLTPHKVRGDVSPIHERLHVLVNSWPYKLTAELEEAFVMAVTELVTEGTLVSMVSYSPDVLTPTFIDNHFNALVFYDYIPWLDTQKDALAEQRIPKVTVYTQGVIINDDVELMEQIERESIDPFTRLKQHLAEYFSIHWWKPGYFSLPLSPSEQHGR